jgi:alkylhydroperoxidase family enzyme
MSDLHRHHDEWHGESPKALFARLAGEPALAAAFLDLGDAFYAQLDGRVLDVVSVRVAVNRHSLYTWRGHVWISLHREGGLTEDEIRRVAAGPDHLTGDARVIAQAVDDQLLLNRFGSATRTALGDQALATELAIGFYDMIARLVCGLPPEAPSVPGLGTPALAASGVK